MSLRRSSVPAWFWPVLCGGLLALLAVLAWSFLSPDLRPSYVLLDYCGLEVRVSKVSLGEARRLLVPEERPDVVYVGRYLLPLANLSVVVNGS